ncbi:MAG: SidA/IucD/PvdA family monooxygenase [Alphaproteobacteria bacterium]|nr:SidA/IucD/PvdA family monooxygenase [Alphaproteobacteria bacterium]
MVRKQVEVAIIGAGFSGVGMAIRLKQAGINSFVLVEKAEDVGGVWRENTYPGAACDAPSHLYSFSFEPHFNWSRRFAPQSEILAYIRHCAKKYGILPHIRFASSVQSAEFNETTNAWEIHLENGCVYEAKFLLPAVGQLHQPKFPDLSGREQFRGRQFHSAEWNHSCDLTGKNVAVVGTGPSAVQIVPAIVGKARTVHVFQRSPGHVRPKADRPYSEFEHKLFRYVPLLRKIDRALQFCQNELRYRAFNSKRLNEAQQEAFRQELERTVTDPVLRRQLTPDYPVGCKRVLPSNDWYPALLEGNCTLVNTPIQQIVPDGVETADGEVWKSDIIIYATGFRTTEFLSSLTVIGRNGQRLDETWKGGAEAHRGVAVSGFPNMFILYGPNTNLGHSSVIYMIESQARYILKCIRKLRRRRVSRIEVTPRAQERYNAWLRERLDRSVWYLGGCTSWFKNEAGKVVTNWPGFSFEYRNRMRWVRLKEYELD